MIKLKDALNLITYAEGSNSFDVYVTLADDQDVIHKPMLSKEIHILLDCEVVALEAIDTNHFLIEIKQIGGY